LAAPQKPSNPVAGSWKGFRVAKNRKQIGLFFTAVAFLAAISVAHADGLEPGQWKVTSTPDVNGAPQAPSVRLRCMTAAETSDLDKTFSPETRTQNATCERSEHEVSATGLKWRMQCKGQMDMEIAGVFTFDSPQHYSADVNTKVSAGPQVMSTHVKIEGERVGECP
jgi:hypothetical protein